MKDNKFYIDPKKKVPRFSQASVPTEHLFALLLYAGRYAFLRSSVAPSEVADYIKTYSPHLHEEKLDLLLKSVQEALKEIEKYPNYKYDIDTLTNLETFLVKTIQERHE